MSIRRRIDTVLSDAQDALGITDDTISVRKILNHPHASKVDVWVTCGSCAVTTTLALLRIINRHTSGAEDTHKCGCGARHDILDMTYDSVESRA